VNPRPRLLAVLALSSASCLAAEPDAADRSAGAPSPAALARLEVVVEEFDAHGFRVLEVDRGRGVVVARSAGERRFFSLVGDQEKARLVTVRLAEGAPDGFSITQELVYGPPGAEALGRHPLDDVDWAAAFRLAVRSRQLRAANAP